MTPTPEPVAEAGGVKLKLLAEELDGFWADLAPGERISIHCTSETERTRRNLRAVLREAAAALRTAPATSAPAPGHTDLMVTPESIDAWLKDNPLPAPAGDGEAEKAADQIISEMHSLKLSEWDRQCLHAKIVAALLRAQPPQPTGDVGELESGAAIRWLVEAARYFERRDTKGEDAAFWSNVANSENCLKIANTIGALNSRSPQQAWNDPDQNPSVPAGSMKGFVVAVFRKHSEKTYTFAASYLNEYELEERHEGTMKPFTGWYSQTGDEDYSSLFETLGLHDGDKLMGWCELPKWPALSPTEPAGRGE